MSSATNARTRSTTPWLHALDQPAGNHGPPPPPTGDGPDYGLRMSKDPVVSGFGAYLENTIADAGFDTPTHFARAAKIDPSVVHRWISEEQRPTLKLLERAAPHLGRTVNALVSAAYPEPRGGTDPVRPTELHPLARDLDRLLGEKSKMPEGERQALETVLRGLLAPYARYLGRRKSA